MNGAENLYRFYAVGSTGSIVESSSARFCGVAIGKYDYTNSMGGAGHAVAAVGMFDLPENRKPGATAMESTHATAPDRPSSSPPPSSPGGPTIRHGSIQVDGRMSVEVIQRVVGQRVDRFRSCYETGVRRNPGLADNLAALKEGTVTVKFVIDRSGGVSQASEFNSDLPDRGVAACVVKVIGALSFPAPEDGIVGVVYPVIFSG
jgi:hypothetical protein